MEKILAYPLYNCCFNIISMIRLRRQAGCNYMLKSSVIVFPAFACLVQFVCSVVKAASCTPVLTQQMNWHCPRGILKTHGCILFVVWKKNEQSMWLYDMWL